MRRSIHGRDAVIVDAVRTPRGRGRPLGASKPGAYAALHPQELAAQVLNAVVQRHDLPPNDIHDVILGCVTQMDDQSAKHRETRRPERWASRTCSGDDAHTRVWLRVAGAQLRDHGRDEWRAERRRGRRCREHVASTDRIGPTCRWST